MNRAEMRRHALAVEGLGAHHRRDEYLQLLGPDESPEMREAMAGMSSCALTVRGLWRRLCIVHPRLHAPYQNAQAVVDVLEIAREAGAWHPLARTSEWVPTPGDVVHVYPPEHVGILVEVTPCPPFAHELEAFLAERVDGGQGPRGAAIARVHARIARTSSGWVDTRLDTGVTRAVTGYVDVDQVGEAFGVRPRDTDPGPAAAA